MKLTHSIIERIEKPFEGEDICGFNLRENEKRNLFFQLRALRSNARNEEKNALSADDLYQLDLSSWEEVLQICITILSDYSKDIEILGWLMESALRVDGLEGLAKIACSFGNLLETIENHFYPKYDEQEHDSDMGPFEVLLVIDNGSEEASLPFFLRTLPLFSFSHEMQTFSYWHYQQYSQKNASSENKNAIQKSITQTPKEELLKKVKIFQEILSSLERIEKLIQEKTKFHYSFSATKETIQLILMTLRNLRPDAFLESPSLIAPSLFEEKHEESPSQSFSLPKTSSLELTREEAFHLMEKLRLFFLKTEPHSPLAFGLEQLIRWGNMPLPELIKELVPDKSSLDLFCIKTGIRREEEQD